jgi:excisionase family DNA binding protein
MRSKKKVAKKKTAKPPVEPKILSAEDAAQYLDIALITLRRWAQQGRIPHLRAGRLLKFRIADLDRWIDLQTTTTWTPLRPQRKP